ncbi:MAG: SDR family NAD(P)-dependent oxidoreductase [Propionicimonas sp.]
MPTTCITGASAGLGAAFAEACAQRGDDLVLVARDRSRLTAAADRLAAGYGVQVEVLVADLAVEAHRHEVAQRLADPLRPIDLLVNNAGFGPSNRVLAAPEGETDRAISVMIVAVAELSVAAAQAMVVRGHGRILNVASLSAWITQGSYSALKAWVKVFSEGLAEEVRGQGVSVTALCPGWVRTEFHERAQVTTASIPNWIWVDASTCATKALADTAKGKVVSIPTLRWKLAAFGLGIVPRPVVRWISGTLTHSRD